MPLIQIKKKEAEAEYKFTNYEQKMLKILDPSVIKSANHDEALLDKLLADEMREADPVQSEQDVYVALERRDPARLLEAIKNLELQDKVRIVEGIKQTLLVKRYKQLKEIKEQNKLVEAKEDKKPEEVLSWEDIARLRAIAEEPNIDLFDLCLRLMELPLYYETKKETIC